MNTESPDRRHVLVGFDGSPDAAGAIELAAQLLPGRTAVIAHLWAPPYARPELRSRVSRRAKSVKEMIELLEREALSEAASINAQQLAEIERLGSSLTSRKHGSREGPSDQRHDSEVALRSSASARLRKASLTASLVVGRSVSTVRSTSDPVGTGTRAA